MMRFDRENLAFIERGKVIASVGLNSRHKIIYVNVKKGLSCNGFVKKLAEVSKVSEEYMAICGLTGPVFTIPGGSPFVDWSDSALKLPETNTTTPMPIVKPPRKPAVEWIEINPPGSDVIVINKKNVDNIFLDQEQDQITIKTIGSLIVKILKGDPSYNKIKKMFFGESDD
jgi:hypothetical protein